MLRERRHAPRWEELFTVLERVTNLAPVADFPPWMQLHRTVTIRLTEVWGVSGLPARTALCQSAPTQSAPTVPPPPEVLDSGDDWMSRKCSPARSKHFSEEARPGNEALVT